LDVIDNDRPPAAWVDIRAGMTADGDFLPRVINGHEGTAWQRVDQGSGEFKAFVDHSMQPLARMAGHSVASKGT
tara:strand:- start:422 stop:643 length:222 start_codon:yes stop_codon:yes gene_type:complete